jgi:hypothetical protein
LYKVVTGRKDLKKTVKLLVYLGDVFYNLSQVRRCLTLPGTTLKENRMDSNALNLLKKRVDAPATSTPTPVESTENTEFLGIHCPTSMKQSLQMYAGIERITLSQFVREVLQMELMRLARGETSSREQLMRERRAAMAHQVTAKANILD